MDGNSHLQIDFALVPSDFLDRVETVFSQRGAAIASHHFLLVTKLHVSIPKKFLDTAAGKPLRSALGDVEVANRFSALFNEIMEQKFDNAEDPNNVTLFNAQMIDGFHEAADRILPKVYVKPKRSWTSPRSLELIQQRNAARQVGATDVEEKLQKYIKRSVGKDKDVWLEGLLASGYWHEVRNL